METKIEIFPAYFLGLYGIELCYGGDEEGGWWYTTYDHQISIQIPAGTEQEQELADSVARKELAVTALDLGLTLPEKGKRGYRSASPEQDAIIIQDETLKESHDTDRKFYE
ncbi:hypothetical protein UFOVP1151_11 [uncultured Caudovirales phage]|uniref:Uncharacterized protein n=1 Tax=uncultured Caudovirales phage TaxID=2100421 RepID=A0A6J5QVL5_9CAUD|nr:hypothetical protein UFOVP1151_11 [uncultured Caudovirales phage]